MSAIRCSAHLACFALALASCGDEQPLHPQDPPHAPETIRDLRASTPTSGPTRSSLQLRWTVPEDPDTQGPPAAYELRYDTWLHAGDTWLEAAGKLDLERRGASGQTDSVLVIGLEPARLYYFALRSIDLDNLWSEWSNVDSLATRNVPPVASFVFVGDDPCPQTLFVDASASSDSEDASGNLIYRWDWQADGSWDTPWSADATASHTYATPGRYVVRLQVRDRGGAFAESAQGLAGLTVTAVQRYIWEEIRHCCMQGPRGTCLQWCSVGVTREHQGAGEWLVGGLASFVSADSIFFTSSVEPQQYGDQGIGGVVDLQVCGAARVQIRVEGPGSLEVSGPNGMVFGPAGTTPTPATLDTTLTNGTYHVRPFVRMPASVHLRFTTLADSLAESARLTNPGASVRRVQSPAPRPPLLLAVGSSVWRTLAISLGSWRRYHGDARNLRVRRVW